MRVRTLAVASTLTVLLLVASYGAAQPPSGRGPMGQGPGQDPAFAADRQLFHQLLQHRDAIRRNVKKTEQGVETLTESDDPEVTRLIQKHVTSMQKRVEKSRPIHLRDPLFAEVFRHADSITMVYEKTGQGVRVTESSDDPYVVQLIQKHAEVVSLFIKHGFAEVHRNHDLPSKPKETLP